MFAWYTFSYHFIFISKSLYFRYLLYIHTVVILFNTLFQSLPFTWHIQTVYASYNCLWVFPGASVLKNPPANAGNAGDEGSIPGSGRSHGGGNGNSLQYSCLGNLMDRGAWQTTVHGVTKGQTWPSMQAQLFVCWDFSLSFCLFSLPSRPLLTQMEGGIGGLLLTLGWGESLGSPTSPHCHHAGWGGFALCYYSCITLQIPQRVLQYCLMMEKVLILYLASSDTTQTTMAGPLIIMGCSGSAESLLGFPWRNSEAGEPP